MSLSTEIRFDPIDLKQTDLTQNFDKKALDLRPTFAPRSARHTHGLRQTEAKDYLRQRLSIWGPDPWKIFSYSTFVFSALNGMISISRTQFFYQSQPDPTLILLDLALPLVNLSWYHIETECMNSRFPLDWTVIVCEQLTNEMTSRRYNS